MKTEVLIAGGGIAGLALAALLGRAGLKTALIDAEPPTVSKTPSGRTAALLTPSLNVLRAAGVWPGLQKDSGALRVMRIVDDSASGLSPARIDFDAAESGQDCFGYNIPNALLRAALIENLRDIKQVAHLAPLKLAGYTVDSAVRAQLSDGTSAEASVLIGTDGRGSMVRAIAGIETDGRDYGQRAITCLIAHSKPHDNIATEFHRPGGPFTLVPLPGKTSSVVWVEKTEDAEGFLKLRKDDFARALQDRTRGTLGEIALQSAPESWPLSLMAAKELTAPRVALAAEAAHVLSPIGAQGLNLSLRDVAVLAETLVDAARVGEDIGAPPVLDRYAKRRTLDMHSRVAGIDALNRAVANDRYAVRGARRLGLFALNALPPLKHLAMEQGLSPGHGEGRLLRGEAL